MNHPQEKSMMAAVDMVQSFNKAVSEAGGAECNAYDAYKNQTLEQIVMRLATNGIRFVFVKAEAEKITEYSSLYAPGTK